MDDPLRLIQYLYDEEVDDATFTRRLTEDERLYREFEQLRETKGQMDRRPSRGPDPAVVDDVVETARMEAQKSPASSHSHGDRPARAPTRALTGRLQTASTVLALVLLVGLGWWQGTDVLEQSVTASSTEGVAETAQRATPAAPDRSAEPEAVPAWDDSDELVRIHRRIEQLQAHSGPDSWGTLQRVDRTRP